MLGATVTVNQHPEYVRLLNAMKRAVARARPWSGTIYRSAPPKWSAGRHMLAGMGSMKSGARFNAAGTFEAVYGSSTPELAMVESLAYQRRAGLPVERALPLVFKAISVEVERLLDLTDAAVITELALVHDELRNDPWWLARARNEESISQAVGRAAHACGMQALSVASAHIFGDGRNVILFPEHIKPPSQVKVLRRPVR